MLPLHYGQRHQFLRKSNHPCLAWCRLCTFVGDWGGGKIEKNKSTHAYKTDTEGNISQCTRKNDENTKKKKWHACVPHIADHTHTHTRLATSSDEIKVKSGNHVFKMY